MLIKLKRKAKKIKECIFSNVYLFPKKSFVTLMSFVKKLYFVHFFASFWNRQKPSVYPQGFA